MLLCPTMNMLICILFHWSSRSFAKKKYLSFRRFSLNPSVNISRSTFCPLAFFSSCFVFVVCCYFWLGFFHVCVCVCLVIVLVKKNVFFCFVFKKTSIPSCYPDQTRHFVGPDMRPNCLQNLSEDDTRGQRVKDFFAKKQLFF